MVPIISADLRILGCLYNRRLSRPGKFTIRLNILKYRYVKKSLVGYIPCYIGLMSFTIHLTFFV